MNPRTVPRFLGAVVAASVALCGFLAPALAHNGPIGSLVAHVKPEGQIDLLIDLDGVEAGEALRLDRDGNNIADPQEIAEGQPVILAAIRDRLVTTKEGVPCPVERVERFQVAGGRVRVLQVRTCPAGGGVVRFEHRLFTDQAGRHQHLGRIQSGDEVYTHLFTRDMPTFSVVIPADEPADGGASGEVAAAGDAPDGSGWSLFVAFIGQGLWHVLSGLDHVLFVLSLMIVVHRASRLALLLTGFTVAHSLTLALGALEWVAPPSQLVESAIALSVLYVAVENIALKEEPRHRPALTLAFGLLHGLGFSGALTGLGLSTSTGLVPALLGFNLGVGVGQLCLVAPLFPLVLWLRRDEARHRRVVVAFSAAVAAVAVIWFAQRALGLSLGWGG